MIISNIRFKIQWYVEILQSISLAQFNSEQRVNLLPSKYQPGCLNRLSQSCLLALLRESILTKANTIACASLPPRRPEIGHPTQQIVLFEICLNKKTISSIYIPHFFRKSEKKENIMLVFYIKPKIGFSWFFGL